MHPEKNRYRDVRIAEEIDARRGEVDEAEQVRGYHRRHRHGRDAEEVLSRQADEKQEQVHVRGIKLRHRDVLCPRNVGRTCEDEPDRKYHQRKGRGIENVHTPPVLFPPDQFFGGETDRHHQELEVKPIRSEPKEQVNAEDHRKRTEAQRVSIPPRPGQQDVESVGEDQLRDDEIVGVIHLPPMPAPVDEYRRVHARLQIVLRPEARFEREGATLAHRRNEQDRDPDEKHSGGSNERPP